MKKFFTLIAAAMLSSGAFAQSEWKNIIVNGNMEGEADPMWSSFWCHDWRQGVEFDEASGQSYAEPSPNATVDNPPCMFMGFAEIVEDPANPANHCARVIVRTKEEADATGTATTDTQNNKPEWVEWDSQFFIYATEPIPEGKQIRLTLKVKAEKAGTFQTQAHYTPGDYNHYQLFGDCSYETEWTQIQVEADVDANHTQEANGKLFQSVAFNLSTMQDGNTIYFDDVKLEIRDAQGPGEFEGWFNMLRHGTESSDQVGDYTTFTGRDGIDNMDEPCPIVTDALDGKPALMVSSVGYNGYKRTAIKDEEGNYVTDENGDVMYEVSEDLDVYITQAGDTLSSLDDWRTQFFITSPHKFVKGETMRVKYQARADKPQSVDTQIHNAPGAYIWYEGIGTIELTEEWQEFEVEREISSNQKGGWTIAFNCNKKKDEDNNLYFRFDEFSFNSAAVTQDERVLGSKNLTLPVPEPNGEAVGYADFTECMEKLECTDLGNLITDNHVLMPINNEGAYSEPLQGMAGVFFDENGYTVDEGSYLFEVADDSPVDKVKFTISNFGESFAGKMITTKILFTFNKWNYLFNTKFESAAEYEEGVKSVELNAKNNGQIFDLMGRRVDQATKGLYIVNGKKYIVK